MILKKVKIYNYRQLQKVELDLQNSLTVLAGPNNSGKTTLISVLKGMFRDKKLSFTYSDIPTNLSTSWVEKIIPVFQSIMVENDKNTGISEIIKKISVDDKLLPEYTILENYNSKWMLMRMLLKILFKKSLAQNMILMVCF